MQLKLKDEPCTDDNNTKKPFVGYWIGVPAEEKILQEVLQHQRNPKELKKQIESLISKYLKWVVCGFIFIIIALVIAQEQQFKDLQKKNEQNVEMVEKLQESIQNMNNSLVPMQKNIMDEVKTLLSQDQEYISFSRRFLSKNILVNQDAATLVNFEGDNFDLRDSVLIRPRLPENKTLSFQLKIAPLKQNLSSSVSIFICDKAIMEDQEPYYTSRYQRSNWNGISEVSNDGYVQFHYPPNNLDYIQSSSVIGESGRVKVVWDGNQRTLSVVNMQTQVEISLPMYFDVGAELYVGVRMFNAYVRIIR